MKKAIEIISLIWFTLYYGILSYLFYIGWYFFLDKYERKELKEALHETTKKEFYKIYDEKNNI